MNEPETVKIYGRSDDLVEVEGRIFGCDEYNTVDKLLYVEFDIGLAFKVEYAAGGVWRITKVQDGGAAAVGSVIRREPAGPPGSDNYSDVVTVTAPVRAVAVYESWPPSAAERAEALYWFFHTLESVAAMREVLNAADVAAIETVVTAARRRRFEAANTTGRTN